jgi:putative selenium metabolism hydrolase
LNTDDAALVTFLQEIVRIDSTPGHEGAITERIVDEMKHLGFDEAGVDVAGNAVGRIGSRKPVVLVDSHVDTIPLHEVDRWKHAPLAAEIADGRMYGLGTCDMKASAAASVYAAARLKREGSPRGTLFISCSIAEEMMEGAALAATVDRCEPDVAVIGEPTDLRLAVGQRGRAKLEVIVTGRPAHAGHPEVGINAAERMAEYIGAAARLEHPRDPELGPRILTCIDVHSNPYPSVSQVPASCTARFDCRFGRGESERSLVAMMSRLGAIWTGIAEPPGLDCHLYLAEFAAGGRQFQIPEFAAAWYTTPSSPIVAAALAGLEQAGIEPRTSTYGFCTNGSLTAVRGIPTIGFGIAREEEAHTTDEWVNLESLYRGTRGYAAIAERLLALDVAEIQAAR